MTSLNAVIDFIVTDATSDDIDRIWDAAKARHSVLRQIEKARAQATIRSGMKVSLHGLSPKYLNGYKGTVEQVLGTTAQITLDFPIAHRGRHFGTRTVRVPVQCCAVLEGVAA